jgi:hypothetical protein
MSTIATTVRRSKGAERALQARQFHWSGVEDDLLWNRKRQDGYTTIPRTLPILMTIIDALTKNQPAGRTYFGLWCRTYDESVLILENPLLLAFEAGFAGERALTTWKQRMKSLVELGLIDARPGSAGDFHYVLMLNPHKAIWHLQDKIRPQMFMQLMDRALEVGAVDMKAPEGGVTAPQGKESKRVRKPRQTAAAT